MNPDINMTGKAEVESVHTTVQLTQHTHHQQQRSARAVVGSTHCHDVLRKQRKKSAFATLQGAWILQMTCVFGAQYHTFHLASETLFACRLTLAL
jgi:type II secretory pathway component PulK